MRTLWISLCVILIIGFVEAQKNLNLPKPVITLEKRSGPPIWRRSPEERRKLALFPKNNKKFVVTERSTLKNEVTKPMVTTKRPSMRKLFVQEKIDERTWSFPPREPMKSKQFNVPVAPHPKRNYNRHYKVKANEKIAGPSTVRTDVTGVMIESSANKVQLNRGNLIQVLNKINAYTNKASSKQVNKVIQNNDPVKVNSPVKVFKETAIDVSAGSIKENMAATKINVQVEKATEKVFLSKPVNHVIQNNKLLNASSLDTVSEEYVDESDFEISKANVTQKTIDEQLNTTTGKVFLSKRVDNATQKNKLLNVTSLNTVSEEYKDESDYESSEENVTQKSLNEQLNKTSEKVFLSKPVDHVMQDYKLLNDSSLDTVSEEYVDLNDNKSSKVNVTQTTINEQLNKTSGKVFLSKQMDNVVQNHKSLNASALDTVSEEYEDENDHESSETNVTHTAIDEKVNDTAEKVFLSKQTKNISQNNDSLKVNAPDNVVDESNSRISHATATKIINDEENESTIISYTFTEKPFTPSEPLEGRFLDTNDLELNDQNDPKLFGLDDKQSSNEKTGDFSKLEELETLMKVIARDNNSYSDDKLLIDSNNAKPFSASIQDINEDTIKNQPQEFQKTLNNFYKVKPAIGLEKENNSTENNVDAAVIEVTENYKSGNIEIKTNDTDTETNRNSINDTMNDIDNLIKVIKNNSTSSESEADIADSQLLKLDLNIVKEYSASSDIILAGYDETTLESRLYDSLNESPIEITFDDLKILGTEENSEEPILIRPVSMIIDQNTADQITNNVTSMDSDSIIGITENIGNGNSGISSEIINLNIEENVKDNNAKSFAIDNLHDLAEAIKDKSMVGDDSGVAVGGAQLVNLDMNIVEEYIDEPNVITTELDGTTPLFYLSDEPLTESPIEIIFDNQEVHNTEKKSIERAFNENVHEINDKSIINALIKTDETVSIINNPATEVSLEIENRNSNTVSPIEILYIEQNSSENNAIIITLPNLDEVLNDNLSVGDNSEVSIGDPEFLNNHINIVNIDFNKPHEITVVVNETLNTTQDYIEGDHGTATSTGIFFNDREPLSTNLSLDVYTNKVTDQPVTEQLNLTEDVSDNVEDSVKKVSLKVDDTITTSQNENPAIEQNTYKRTDSPNLIKFKNENDDADFVQTTEVTITASQLLNLDVNISEANSDKPNTITIVLDETTQTSYVNDEHVKHTLTGILSHNLEPLTSNNEQLNMPLNEISNELVTNQPNPNDEDIQVTEQPINLTDKDISDEWLVNSSNLPNNYYSIDPILFKLNNPKEKAVLNELNIAGEEISSETIMDNSINSSDAISSESSIVTNAHASSSTLEEMFEIMIAQSDQSRKLADEISNETYVLNDSSSSVVTQEEISDQKTAEKSENTTDKVLNESHILNDSSNGIVSQEEISEEMTADHTKNFDETSNESHVLNDSSSSLSTSEEMSYEITAVKSENVTDDILDESHILNDRSNFIIKQEEISEEMTADHTKNLTNQISNESHVLNDSSSSLPTTEEISDEITADKSEYITAEISNNSFFLNDSSSDILTQEELSDDMTDLSENLTDEISNESYVLNDSFSSVVTTEEVFNKITHDESENITDESSNENDSSSSVVTTEEILDGIKDDKSEYLPDEVSNESSLEVIHTSDVKSEELTEQSKNITGKEASNEPVIDIRHPITELASNEMIVSRIKRSNNIIEEENLATTLSGFKYTGQYGTRLGQDLRFKNINA